MKITQVSMFYLPVRGGQEVYVESLRRVLDKCDITSDVIQAEAGVHKEDHVITLPRIRGVWRLLTDADWFVFNKRLAGLKKYLRGRDVLISHYPFHYPIVRWHERVVVISHGLDWREPPRTLADKYRIYAARLCKKQGAYIVANDTCFLRWLGYDVHPGEKCFQRIERHVWFIPNCVDTGVLRPTGENREKIILVPRNIRWVRGIHVAIEAFGLFAKRNPGFVMHVVGGPLVGNRYYLECQEVVKKLGLEEKVIFLGSVPRDALVRQYNKAMLTLIPTLELEGTSLSAIESMACKTPVVSTNVGGLTDLPGAKAEPSGMSIAARMETVLAGWEEVRDYQYSRIATVFNLRNWEEAWKQVLDEVTGGRNV